jgi:hypothetical protein
MTFVASNGWVWSTRLERNLANHALRHQSEAEFCSRAARQIALSVELQRHRLTNPRVFALDNIKSYQARAADHALTARITLGVEE